MRIPTLAIVGVGLIGGSIGLAARRRGVAGRVVGVGRDPNALDRARARGVVDEISLDPQTAAADADLMVFCTPVDLIARQVVAAGRSCRPGALLTDAGSTKAAIVRDVQGRLPPGVAFVGSHPLAGSEKQGADHASASLFEGRLVLVTPGADTDDTALSRILTFWQALGARVRVMAPEEHDRALALTSHLPHLVAAALAGVLPPELYELTAGGFRDTTRVAAGSPALWGAIFEANREALLAGLDRFDTQLRRFRQALADGDRAAVEALLGEGKRTRDGLSSV
jgi:prephenate dehydrogenase